MRCNERQQGVYASKKGVYPANIWTQRVKDARHESHIATGRDEDDGRHIVKFWVGCKGIHRVVHEECRVDIYRTIR